MIQNLKNNTTLRPVRLELEGFRSFKHYTSIEFSATTILLTGKRTDCAVTSGTGKSSIVQAIAFALGFCDLPATELKNWDSDKMSVKLTLSDGTNEFIICRTPKLSLIINGVPYVSQSVAAEEKLVELLKTPLNIVEALTYRSQRSFGRFVNSNDQYKKDFLSSVLGLDDLEKACEKAELDLKNTERLTEGFKSSYTAVSDIINMSQDRSEFIAAAKTQVADAQIKYDAAKLNNQVPESLIFEINNSKNEINKLRGFQRDLVLYSSEVSSITSKLTSLASEINHLNEQKCFTCNQKWDNNSLLLEQKQTEGGQLLARRQALIDMIPKVQLEIDRLPELELNLAQKNTQLSNIGQEVSRTQQVLSMAIQVLQSEENGLRTHEANISKQAEIKSKLIASSQLLEKQKHIANIFSKSGFMSVIFSNVLAEIEQKTNDFMTSFENVNHIYLKFESNSITKGGSIKKNIAINLYRQSEIISRKSLSGGQQCAIELCVDLAIAEVVKRRTGSPLGWMILDEGMDGLDVESKRAAIEALKPKISGTLIIIDHSTEIKESFDNVIEVTYDGKCSFIKA
jgi:DNA repair exonuclease SbcCD ATPase subunit